MEDPEFLHLISLVFTAWLSVGILFLLTCVRWKILFVRFLNIFLARWGLFYLIDENNKMVLWCFEEWQT